MCNMDKKISNIKKLQAELRELTNKRNSEIRRMYAGKATHESIAERFEITAQRVGAILRAGGKK